MLPLYLFEKAFAATPTAVIFVADDHLASGETSLVRITFSEAVTGFDLADLTIGSGTLGGLTNYDNINYTATLTPPLSNFSGPFHISLDHSGVTAAGVAGNGTTISNNYFVDTVGPSVTSVDVPANGTYGAGEDLNFTVNMDEVVFVTDTPTISIVVGTTTVYATYAGGSGSNALRFRYTVQTGLSDSNGITIGALSLNGGSIMDEAGNAAALMFNNVGSTANVLVNAIAPTITSMSPASGPTSGGTTVTLTGTNLTGATAVKFGATAAASYTVNSATSITATAPAGSLGTVDVTVTTSGGTSATSAVDQYTYMSMAAPTIVGLSPISGPTSGGTTVTLTGTNLTGATAVKFGATSASYTVNSATSITAIAPAGSAGTIDVTVMTSGGTSATSAADQYTYLAEPTITSMSPTSGPTSGGTIVTLTGTNLTDATAVKFGATAAASYTVNSATQITATAPVGSAGTVDVTVTTSGGTSATSAADQYTYLAEPTITNMSPTSGPTSGGTIVTLTGTNLTRTTGVTFGGRAATSYTVNSAMQIMATAPAGSAGTVNIVVTTPGGTATLMGGYTYFMAEPTITSVSPTSGPTSGGMIVTLTGTNLTDATAVKFGATAASYTVNSATQITAIAPAGSAGTIDVTVTTPGGTSATSAADQYTYHAEPTITNMSPTSGPTFGGTIVTLTGTNLTDATAVKFGATAASYTVNSATQITAIAPAGSAGTVDVTVTTPGGTSVTSGVAQFTRFVVTYAISPLSDEALNALTAGYASGMQETKTVNLTRTGSGDLVSLTTTLGGTNASSFTITQPTVTTLNGGKPSTTFTVKANDELAAGTYKATVTVSASGMTPVTFNVTQVVNSGSSGGTTPVGTTPLASTHLDIDQNGIMIDSAKIDSSKPSVTLEVTPKDGFAYVSIPASILTSIEGKNATFFIEIKTPYGSYQVPVNLASLIPGLKDLLAKNNVNNDDISFKITLTDKSGDKDIQAVFANSLPNAQAMGAIVDFHIYIINTKTGQAIGTVDKFSKALTRVIPMPKSVGGMPAQWGAFRYNVTTKKLEFVAAEKKQIDGVWVVKISSYSNSVYVVAQNTVSFVDVQQHWSQSDVDLAAAKGLVEGVGGGLYDPNKALTRAEFTAMLVRALGRGTSDKYISPYNDVRPGTWYSGEVSIAKELGLLAFVKENSFSPNQPLTREEMASMLAAVAGLEQLPISKEPVSLNGFKDIGNADTAYLEDLRLMVKLDIMTGTGANTFDPKGESTRAQAAVVFIRMLQTMGSIDR
ncbi:IPT/TIG domain-containing protein [Paenibacillus marchantiae]|uniref:IPT/TIG domain-containing protein n=1 Tax=Paenibacillus marchantiae TaxID=3026433 RepID=UPI00237ACB84|nr:IPT/TIG domain-containing protein [Paenibacillus marchantiae]WDQ35456.1 IPT/TIG domain-containing protein [Paenibacillus marchantiae]